jgi:hypothetical protein
MLTEPNQTKQIQTNPTQPNQPIPCSTVLTKKLRVPQSETVYTNSSSLQLAILHASLTF